MTKDSQNAQITRRQLLAAGGTTLIAATLPDSFFGITASGKEMKPPKGVVAQWISVLYATKQPDTVWLLLIGFTFGVVIVGQAPNVAHNLQYVLVNFVLRTGRNSLEF